MTEVAPANEAPDASLRRAKRLFLLSLSTFVLLVVAMLLLSGSSEEDTHEQVAELPLLEPEPTLTLQEIAYQKGQMLGLSEHPATLPKYESGWVREISKKEVLRDPNFAEADEAEIPQLVEAFYAGYTEQFENYFDDREANELGYAYGLKFDPLIHGLMPRPTSQVLRATRAGLTSQFQIETEVEWQLFCEAFKEGFLKGYGVTKEGVTKTSIYESISLLDE
ncbi:MAG: hypothetical protein AAGH40_11830 [Verrucomicrobiota bacterium]